MKHVMLERFVSVYNNETARMPSMVFVGAYYLTQQLQPDRCNLNASKFCFSVVQDIFIYAAPVIISRMYIYSVSYSWHDTLTRNLQLHSKRARISEQALLNIYWDILFLPCSREEKFGKFACLDVQLQEQKRNNVQLKCLTITERL